MDTTALLPPDQPNGLLADLRWTLDPVALAEAAGIDTLDGWQRDELRGDHKRRLWLVSRQAGKSLCAAILALHAAICRPPALVLIIAPALRQSDQMMKGHVYPIYDALPDKPEARRRVECELELENGSRIIELPDREQNIRGYSNVDLILCDEAAALRDNLIPSVTPMLAHSDGTLIALSTPRGTVGWFYKAWHEWEGWHRRRVDCYESRVVPADFVAKEKISNPAFEQEYELHFVEDGETLFDAALIRDALVDVPAIQI